MATTIKVLDERLRSLIAAGEVVERPASVVKELFENALDAGASSVDIEIMRGGREKISVLDDGSGMGKDDALMAFGRHATSKLTDINDLVRIHTLGFRGEALPSIASVSRTTLFTRTSGDDTGWEVRVEGGDVKYIREAGAPFGTRVVVEDLFYSVPARRKFLKTEKTEYSHILDVCSRISLSRPDVAFRLVIDGREAIVARKGSLRERVGAIVGKNSAAMMVDLSLEEEEVRVVGFAGSPEDTRITASNIYIFVNDRPVRDGVVMSAITRAYKGVIFGHRYPVAVVFIQVSPSDVDVNVHPAKTQVKFRDMQKVVGVVFRAVELALRGAERIATRDDGVYYKPSFSDREIRGDSIRDSNRSLFSPWGGRPASIPSVSSSAFFFESAIAPQEPKEDEKEVEERDKNAPVEYRILGQVHNTYIVAESKDGFVLIDQHAAHERILYEEIKARHSERAIPVQPFLFPQKIELSPSGYEAIMGNVSKLIDLGIDISDFGHNTIVVSSLPSFMKDADVLKLITSIGDELGESTSGSSVEEVRDRLFVVMACHGAIRKGARLSISEMEALVEMMRRTPFALHCPHGRPTMVTIELDALEKKFKRTS